MESDHIIFAGASLNAGRKPILFAALDQDLKILALVNWTISETISCLNEYKNVLLAISSPARKSTTSTSTDFRNKLAHAGYKAMSKTGPYRWLETDAQKCFLALCGNELLPRRTLEGRIQRSLILYDEGLQTNDPMDFFEEITRHKIMQGLLPLENLYSSKELDALVTAYLAWMAVQRASLVNITDNFILPDRE